MMRSWAAFLVGLLVAVSPLITSVRAAEPVTVTGQVLDPEGRPVPNAQVGVVYLVEPPIWLRGISGVADEHGRFALQFTPDEKRTDRLFQVWGVAEGHGLGVARGAVDWPDVTIRLTKPASIVGIATDADGNPLRGARAVVFRLDYQRQGRTVYLYTMVADSPLCDTTDGEGRFRIDGIPKEARSTLFVHVQGYGYATIRMDQPQRDLRVGVLRGGTVSGRVLHGGRPLPGVRISARGGEPHFGSGETTTGPEGTYAFRNIGPDWCTIELDVPEGRTAVYFHRVEVESEATVGNVDFELTDGGVVRGTVREERTGQPLPGITVGARHIERGSAVWSAAGTQTDKDGRYELRVPPGRQRVYLSGIGPQYRSTDEPPDRHSIEVVEGQVLEGVDFAPKRDPVVHARVLGPDGRPLADARLWNPEGIPWRRTDEQGRFQMVLRPGQIRLPGRYWFITSADDSLGGLFWVETKDEETDFRLQPIARAVGVVCDLAGGPVPGILVRCNIVPQREHEYYGYERICIAESDADGIVHLPMLPPGVELRLRAATGGYRVASEWPETLTLQPGETRDLGVLTMNPAGRTVSGLVQDADTDAPASNALVVDLSTGREAVTDDRGRFELTHLRLDRSALLLVRDRSQRLYALRMVDPDEQQPVNLVLKPLASVEGYVVDPQWRPVGGARVVAEIQGRGYYGVRTEGREYLPGLPEARTDERGHYRLDNLLDGMTYEIRAEAEGHMGAQELTAEGGSQVVVPDLVIWPPPQPPD